jgi:hypothetical protein
VENPLRLLRRRCLGLGDQPACALGEDRHVRFGEVGVHNGSEAGRTSQIMAKFSARFG